MTDPLDTCEAEYAQIEESNAKRWSGRCAVCGNPRHYFVYYARGWLAWHLVAKWWPVAWGIPPFLATAGDWIYDHRDCEQIHGPLTDGEGPIPNEAKAIILVIGASFVVAALALGVALR